MPTAGRKSSTGRRVRPRTPTDSTSTTRPTTTHKTQVRSTLRIAGNTIYTNYWRTPTDSVPGPDSALRTTTAAPIIGAHPRKPGVQLRIADNCACNNNRCLPKGHVAGGLVKVNAGDLPPGQTAAENGWTVNVYETRPRELRIADNKSRPHHWYAPTNCRSGRYSAMRTTPDTPIIGAPPQIFPSGTPTNRQSTRANTARRVRPVR